MKLTQFFTPKEEPVTAKDTKVARCETIVAGFFAEHDLPFILGDHFWDMIRHAAPDSEILKTASAKRTKMSYLTVHGLGEHEARRVAELCKNRKYSIMIDESTDVSVRRVMALVVRLYVKDDMATRDFMLDLVEPFDGTARGLFDAMMKSLEAAGMDTKSIIGSGADNCSTMMGGNAGFQKLLKDVVPDVFVMGCSCHSLALCAGHAARCLPDWLETLIKDIASYLSRSPKRQETLSLLQKAVKAPCHSIPKVAMTHWLSRGAVIHRILEQWEPLLLFFSAEAHTKEGKVDRATEIAKRMKEPGTKHMLLFVSFVIKKVDQLNLIFQSEDFQLHRLYQDMSDGYRLLLAMYVKPSVLSSVPLHEINPTEADIAMSLDRINLGGRCETHLMVEPLGSGEKVLRTDAQAFLKDLCSQIRKRFDLDRNSILAELKVLSPRVAMLPAEDEERPRTLAPLLARFKHVVKDADRDYVCDEWRGLPAALATAPAAVKEETPPVFWAKVAALKNAVGQPRFKHLCELMGNMMSLPHSTASVERTFSQMNRVKTSQTNRLLIATTKGRMLASQAIKESGNAGCTMFEPSASLLQDVMKNGPRHRSQSKEVAVVTRCGRLNGVGE